MSQPLSAQAPEPELENSHLKEIWGRFEIIARKLWIENSSAAVGLQSLIEEFHAEIARVEETLLSYRRNYLEQKEIIEKTYFAETISKLESALAKARDKIAAQEGEISLKISKIKDLEGFIAVKEEDLSRAHDRHIKSTLENSEQFNQKIETLYQEVMAKESALLPLWGRRLKELEDQYRARAEELELKNEALLAEHKQREAALEKNYQDKLAELRASQQKALDDITNWSSRKLREEQELLRRANELELRTQELEHEIKKKHLELETLKENLRQEVAQVVKRYQASENPARAA
ncbi:MAG TPA: hypothetical protein VNK24_09130 [Elusimicrobiota bacterium]|nr:hypothetical protein [Elusimicrobiota bacterium]